ncbi:2-deoxy-D-gluconate 3-dehydrogenase [Terrimonas sp.]|uniref:SDR family NAD(P)-dependent oxidoreductase n=1 Tax=Terrimonas sp. TaxID=1914338 RepID=UPI000D508CE5|nr:SDR family NAD(P)-dependent oxidoreductase [Terrimonas sp.]PVD50239.1 2-deoxy-D-gluconate 3-dehydrogenase [Terrimonas sp.]
MSTGSSLFDLRGKAALVTGSSKGIGKAIAVMLANCGADILGVSSQTHQNDDLEKQVNAAGRNFKQFTVDLSKRDDLYTFIHTVKSGYTVDILINNAGIILRKPAAEHSDEYWDKVLSVNLDAQFILAREFGKEMIDRKDGKIIFICSMLSYQGGINVPGYTASKSAVAGLVKALANEWAIHNVNVNGIAPGYIGTDNTQALRDDAVRNKSILERIPAGRWGSPEDISGAVAFLCSAFATYIHGTILNVDGGWMAR